MNIEQWSEFMPTVSDASWERRGEPDTGVGGVRRMRIGRSVIRDRIVDGSRPHHHAYVASLPWYMPVTDYRGDIRIDDHATGSRIVWTVTFASRVPGVGKAIESRIGASYVRLAAALARRAERAAETR